MGYASSLDGSPATFIATLIYKVTGGKNCDGL